MKPIGIIIAVYSGVNLNIVTFLFKNSLNFRKILCHASALLVGARLRDLGTCRNKFSLISSRS